MRPRKRGRTDPKPCDLSWEGAGAGRRQLGHDYFGELVKDGGDILDTPIKALDPQVCAGATIDQLSRHRDPGA